MLLYVTKYKSPLFRVMEIHRICEVTATPTREGANLSGVKIKLYFEQ